MAGGSARPDLLSSLNILSLVGAVGDLTDAHLLRCFLTGPDADSQAAFAALVERHGPMVLRVSRRVLGDSHDAQDAFQATFLVLARRAGSVGKADSVAGWLHGVVLRVALRSKANSARRMAYERRGAAMKAMRTGAEEGSPESWPELHEEIARLPERYREPVVLCYLEGLSTAAAALRIGCPRGTVLSRLSRARERLRGRLTRRGVTLPTALTATVQTPESGPTALPLGLVEPTVRMSLGFAGRRANEAAVASAAATALATGVLTAMTILKLKFLGVVILCCGLALGGMQTFARQRAGSLRQKELQKTEKASEPAGVSAPAEAQSPGPDKALAEAKLEVTRQALIEFEVMLHREGVSLTDSWFALWERRRVEALRDSGAGKTELIKALEKYVSQMRRQYLAASEARQKGQNREDALMDMLDAESRALEGEFLLVRESGAGKAELVKALEKYVSQLRRLARAASQALQKGRGDQKEGRGGQKERGGTRMIMLDAEYRALEGEILLHQVKAR